MMAMAKVVLLLLVVFKAAALENSHETDSNHELSPHSSLSPSPLSHPPQSSIDVDKLKPSTIFCAVRCVLSCLGKKSFQKAICIEVCLVKCAISPSDCIDEIDCTVDCAQSSTDGLRSDARVMDDRVGSCYQQCKRD